MEPISERLSSIPAARQAETAAEKAPEKRAGVPQSDQSARRDVYEHARPEQPIGLYRLESDENGEPNVRTDSEHQPERPDAAPPSKEARKKETLTGDTDAVDREIEKLKKEQQELKRKIRTEKDTEKKQALKQKLTQIENELRMKDNDTYRRQHTRFF